MRVVQVSSKHCHICEMMKRLLGDSVDYIMVEDHPEALEGSAYQTFPIYRVLEGETFVDLCAGAMPAKVLEKKVAAYVDSRR
jgi:hypothetical protein